MNLMKKTKNKAITLIITIAVTFSILGIILGAYGSVKFQEGNLLPLISSIIKLQFTDVTYIQYSSSPDQYISELEPASDRYKIVIGFMENKGWGFMEQMGSGLLFEKDEEQIIIGTRQYTRNYYVWNIPEQESISD